jgi:DNA-binding HxlR family transcriptional regulator
MQQTCFCPVKGVIDLVGKKWVLLIVNSLGNFEVQRFKDLQNRLKGISPKTLSDTLTRLQERGLVSRESFNEIPPRVEYRLTSDGKEFREIIQPLIAWTARRDGWNSKKCPSCSDQHGSDGCYCHRS